MTGAKLGNTLINVNENIDIQIKEKIWKLFSIQSNVTFLIFHKYTEKNGYIICTLDISCYLW